MEAEATEVRLAFCEAYPLYVARVLVARGITIDDVIGDAIVVGTVNLDRTLAQLEKTSPSEQRSSPLELFREALRPIDSALATSEIPEPPIDSGHGALHAWDRYQLSPGSPKALGERAYDAHLRWGVAKAMAFGAFGERTTPERPTVRVMCRDEDADPIALALGGLGYKLAAADSPRPVLTIVDIDVGEAAKMISQTVSAHGRVVVYGDAVDDLQAMALSAAGAWKVVSRADVLNRLESVLPAIG